jgi:general secretion pathway protein G
MYKSFSLIELIFAILIIAILASIALPKFLNTTTKTSLIKVKSDLLLIQNGLLEYKNNSILKGDTLSLNSLDNGNTLFANILPNHNFFNKKEANNWEKISTNQYNFWFDNQTNVLFTYNSDDLTFTCDKTTDKCKEILQ